MAKDLTVRLVQDQPGEAAKVADALGSASVNMEGFAEMEGLVHVLVADGDLEGSRRALQGAGLSITSRLRTGLGRSPRSRGALGMPE